MGQIKRTSQILIAEENLLFRRGLSALIAGDRAFQVVADTANTENLLLQLQAFQPHVLVIDAALLMDSTSQRLALKLRQGFAGMRILILAQQDDEKTLAAAISCGATGLVLKKSPPAQLLAALHSVAFGEGGMNFSGLLPDLQALAVRTPAQNHSALTAREQEVMRLLADGKTVRRVANDLSLSMKTIEAHKLNLMRKLDIHDRASLIAHVNREIVTRQVAALALR